MKKVFIILLSLISISLFAQTNENYFENLKLKNSSKEYKVFVKNINKDSLFLEMENMNYGYPLNKIEYLESSNVFKEFIINNNDLILSDDLNFKYTQHRLELFRKQRNLGKSIMFGSSATFVGYALLSKDYEYVSIVGILCSIAGLSGYIIDWNASKWLENVTIPEYNLGIGYKFNLK
ncbi:MAG: hypothetical protein ACOC1K_00465 [Nanoarchaeota archaeon]